MSATLRYPVIAGSIGFNEVAVGSSHYFDISITVNNLTAARRSPTVAAGGTIPIMEDGAAFGGQALVEGANQINKLQLDGFIDTPCTTSGNYNLPSLIIGGIRFTYGEVIAMFYEGRAHPTNTWGRVDPVYFIDPYGRTYTSPRILDFNGSFVEAVPGRTNISLQLKV